MRLSVCVLVLGLSLFCGSLVESKTYLITMKKRRGGKKADDVARGLQNKGKKAKGLKKLDIVIAEDLTDEEVQAMNRDPDVQNIEPDGVVTATDCGTYTDTVAAPVPWGLDAIGSSSRNDNIFSTQECQPNDVVIYIFDTGIDLDHPEFRDGRAEFFKSAPGFSNDEDHNGHGTHVAGTAAGIFFGVSKRGHLKAVKALDDNGSGSWSGLISLLEDVVTDHESRGPNAKSVINMSLGGGKYQTVNDAVKTTTEAGLVVVVAAGNSDQNADTKSPASEPTAITVGSVTSSLTRSSFSNYGNVVDIYAPGSSIISARTTDPSTSSRVKRARQSRQRKCNKRRQRKGLCTTAAPPPATTPPPTDPPTPTPAPPTDPPAPTTPATDPPPPPPSTCVPTSPLPSDIDYSNTPSSYKSGTSMASPHVTGVVANRLATFDGSPSPTPAQVEDWIVDNSLKNVVSDVPSGPNRFLQAEACP